MINIRHGVFETNSSSSHSIVITTKDDHYSSEEISKNVYVYKNGEIRFWPRELDFGRSPFEILYSFIDKAHYAFATYNTEHEEDEIKRGEICEIIYKYIPECKAVKFPANRGEDEKFYYGDIDHQSYGILSGFLEHNDITMEEFLTNKKYIIVIDGDEYNTWQDMKNIGIITNIAEEY